MSGTTVITIAHGRHAHLELQRNGLSESLRPVANHVVVAMDDPDLVAVVHRGRLPCHVVEITSVSTSLPLTKARNIGAEAAIADGADLLVFLDVDCVPSTQLIGAYEAAQK